MISELKPCPFCGCDNPETDECDFLVWAVFCPVCKAEIQRDTEEEALAIWNTRAESVDEEDEAYPEDAHINSPWLLEEFDAALQQEQKK